MTEAEFIKSLSDKIKSGQTTVTYMVKGKWSNKGYKKLFGIKGEQVAEYENEVLCAFPAKELLQAVIKTLPKVTIKSEEQK